MLLHESLILLFSVLAFHALATRTISEAFGSKSQPCHQSLHFKVLNSRLSNISVCSCVLTIFELSRDGSKLLSFLFVAHNHYFHKFYVSLLVSISRFPKGNLYISHLLCFRYCVTTLIIFAFAFLKEVVAKELISTRVTSCLRILSAKLYEAA